MRLKHKKCVITGAARGIGKAIAEAFVAQGAEVVLTDMDPQLAEKTARNLGCAFAGLDVSREDHWARLVDLHPNVDVVVNNAGITGLENAASSQDPENASLEDWRHVHRVNLDGTFLGCRYAIRAMRDVGEGSIINMSSRSGMVGIPAAAAYASSKAAIRNHTKSVALYCAQQGLKIRCNSIHPGAILTPMWEPMLGTDAEREKNIEAFVQDTPLKRFGQPEEVATMGVYLASDESRYVTGSEFTIDGGILAGSAASPARE